MNNSFKNWQTFYKEFFKNDFPKWPADLRCWLWHG